MNLRSFCTTLWFYCELRARKLDETELLEYAVKTLHSLPSSDDH